MEKFKGQCVDALLYIIYPITEDFNQIYRNYTRRDDKYFHAAISMQIYINMHLPKIR